MTRLLAQRPAERVVSGYEWAGGGGRLGGCVGGYSWIDAAPQQEERKGEERSPSAASPVNARQLQSQRGVQLQTQADSMDVSRLLPLLLLSGCLPKVSQLYIFAP